MCCRELYGRGLIGSLKASAWYQQLQEKQKVGVQQRPASDGVRVQARACASLPVLRMHPMLCSSQVLRRGTLSEWLCRALRALSVKWLCLMPTLLAARARQTCLVHLPQISGSSLGGHQGNSTSLSQRGSKAPARKHGRRAVAPRRDGMCVYVRLDAGVDACLGAMMQTPPNPAGVAGAQVETLAGSVLAVEVDAGASLADMRAGIERAVGVGVKQQRLIILGAGGLCSGACVGGVCQVVCSSVYTVWCLRLLSSCCSWYTSTW